MMSINLPLSKMSLSDKLSTMEALWQDLCRASENACPSWHEVVLAKREKIVSDKPCFSDWEQAKNRIRSSLK